MRYCSYLIFICLFLFCQATYGQVVVEDDGETEVVEDEANDNAEDEAGSDDEEADEEAVDGGLQLPSLVAKGTFGSYVDSLLTASYSQTIRKRVYVRRKGSSRRRRVYRTYHLTGTPTAGCLVYDLTADSVIYQFHPTRMLIPASTQKLFTAMAMLTTYGTEHVYDTRRRTITLLDSLGGSRDSVFDEDIPLKPEMRHMLKSSDNAEAEKMLRRLIENDPDEAEEQYDQDAIHDEEEGGWTYDGCRDVVRNMVRLIRHMYHPDEDNTADISKYYAITDGSGLSHANQSTAQSQVDLLRFAYHDKEIFPYLYECLPVAGVDGTLGSRMQGTSAAGNVHAKTGTVSRVSTLAGYVKDSRGHDLAFSILINDCGSTTYARALQDRICQLLSEQ